MELIKVKSKSNPKMVAGAIAAFLREKGKVEIQAVGAGAVNQAVKAIAITKSYVVQNGIELITIPEFAKIMIDEQQHTAIKFSIENRKQ